MFFKANRKNERHVIIALSDAENVCRRFFKGGGGNETSPANFRKRNDNRLAVVFILFHGCLLLGFNQLLP